MDVLVLTSGGTRAASLAGDGTEADEDDDECDCGDDVEKGSRWRRKRTYGETQ